MPVTVTGQLFSGEPRVVENERVAVPVPPGPMLTLDGLTPQPGQDAQSGGAELARLTVPLKLLRLVREIVELADEPAGTVRLVGLAEIVKSGVADVLTCIGAEASKTKTGNNKNPNSASGRRDRETEASIIKCETRP